ncbi:penicillin-binding protein activator [Halomonas binhaiensis]|uniref:Penicillin-binding protein activator n=1 Tax=Halomonas binhaiensis TaxID=2562282 RepID=A0A5C1NGH0_9GAMM|nr:penicillin-binding protein activator [Halomonas binhaiensis]QEM81337.1 penicillin-binding protein activator [Halomonas binhaiensis]
MMISTRGPLAATLLALTLAGCSAPGVIQRTFDEDPDQLLTQAAQQQPAQAAQTRLQAADILARSERRPEALEVAKQIDDSQLKGDNLRQWALLLSELGDSEGDPQAVLRATSATKLVQFSDDQLNLLLLRQGLAFGQLGQAQKSTRILLQVQTTSGREDINDAIWAQLSTLSERQANALAQPDNAIVTGWLSLAALVRNSNGNIDQLFTQLDDWRVANTDHPANRRMPKQITAMRDLRGKQVTKIAVMLPESGPLAGVADAIEEGIRARQKVSGNSGAKLAFLDTSSASLDQLYQTAKGGGAQVVIGPLDKKDVSQLESRSSVPLPTLALNYGEGTSNTTVGLFEYGLSAEDEARQAARRGWQDGHRKASVLVPNNDWGQRVGEAFWNEWKALGGEVASAVRYSPSAPATDSTRRAVSEPRPDMLFLLALPDYARQVRPTLQYYNALKLPVYATSHLYEGRPQPNLDRDLDGVQFLDIPWQIPDAAVGGAEALPFYASYQQLRSEDNPGTFRLKAMGVDAYELARRLPQYEAIPQTRMQGATGMLGGNGDGRIYRELPWAVFVNGVPAPILAGGDTDDTASSEQR